MISDFMIQLDFTISDFMILMSMLKLNLISMHIPLLLLTSLVLSELNYIVYAIMTMVIGRRS
jgi:hypothetical protein